MKELSIVIPCYNCEKTINRLLDSIIFAGLTRDQYEVIVCNDRSTDGTLDKIRCYEDKMDIVYCKTTREFHCPGNTRQAALPYISGEWFTFIDNDDAFEPGMLKIVMSYIRAKNIEYVLATNFREYYETTAGRDFLMADADTWLHGKFFNKHHILDEFKCHFKDDLFSHEDVYFNSMVLAHLISIGKDYVYFPICTYKWMHNEESLSRSYYREKDFYIEEYLGDYIEGASDPYFDMWKSANDDNTKMFALNQIMMTLLHAYFYYEAAVARLGQNNVIDTMYVAIRSLKRRMIEVLNSNYYPMSDKYITDYIYSLPERYHSIKGKCFAGSNPFVESQSFRDFILNL